MIGQILLLGILFVALACRTDSPYALLSSTVGQLLLKNMRIRRTQRYFTGSVYIALGLSTAIVGSEKK